MVGFCGVRENLNYSITKKATKPVGRVPFLPTQLYPINWEECKSRFCHFHFFKVNWHAYETEFFKGTVFQSVGRNPNHPNGTTQALMRWCSTALLHFVVMCSPEGLLCYAG